MDTHVVFGYGGGLLFTSLHTKCKPYITHITQITLKTRNYTLLIYNCWLYIQILFDFSALKHGLDDGVLLGSVPVLVAVSSPYLLRLGL